MNNSEEKNTLLIVGVVLSVLLPPVGLIICLIELNNIKKNNKPGGNLAVNGIMISILVFVVMIIGSIVLVVVHNKQEEQKDKVRSYERELKKICEIYGDYAEYDSYDNEHPNKKFIQCRNGDCYMYKNGETLASVECN